MSQQERITKPSSRRRRSAQPTLQIQSPSSNEQAGLDHADDVVLEIVAERLGERRHHEVVEAVDDERIEALPDELLYDENLQESGQ